MRTTRPLLPLAVLALAGPLASASTWHVDAAGTAPGTGAPGDPFTSIQYAIDRPATVPGDTILVAPGTYLENLKLTKHGLLIRSTGSAADTTLRPSEAGPVVLFSTSALPSPTLEGFTITGAFGPDAEGARSTWGNDGVLLRCVLRGNPVGWRIFYDGHVTNTVVTGNTVGIRVEGGGILYADQAIIYDNATDFGCHGFTPTTLIWYSLSEGVPCGLGQYHHSSYADPLWWDAAGHDYALRPGSPAIDTGSPTAPADPDGSVVDIGPVPFDATHAPASPATYCTAKVNSQGCTPAIGFAGAPSASGAPFDVTCSQVLNNKSGLLFYGYGSKAVPFQGGYLCVRSPARRTALQSSGGSPPPDDCSGLYAFDFDARIQSGADPALVAGQGVFIQYWFRDPLGTPPFTTGRSDAVAATIAP